MKTPFLKMLRIASYVLVLSTLLTSCQDNNEIPSTPNAQRLKASVQRITSPNAMTNNPNSMDHASDFLDEFDCFDLVFPLDVTDGTQNTTINSYDELETYYTSLPTTADPNFVYPIAIEFEDGTQQAIQDEQALEDAFDQCFDEIDECFTLNFPLTVTDGNGNNTTVNSEDELATFYDGLDMNAEPNFVYPFTVTKTEDNSVVTINNDDEFDTLYEECYDFEDCDDLGECFTIQFPITATSTASGQVTINNEDELYTYFDGLGDNEDPQFSFPITITLSDGTNKIINSLEELEDEVDACYDDEVEVEDCFTFQYPLTLNKEDGTSVTVNSDDEFDSFIDGLANDEGFSFNYPFNVQLRDGTIQSVNSEGDFFLLFDSCL
ncbi:MAG: hypothetical protein JXR05_12485 [Flavobacteriaceae bacterium]